MAMEHRVPESVSTFVIMQCVCESMCIRHVRRTSADGVHPTVRLQVYVSENMCIRHMCDCNCTSCSECASVCDCACTTRTKRRDGVARHERSLRARIGRGPGRGAALEALANQQLLGRSVCAPCDPPMRCYECDGCSRKTTDRLPCLFRTC